MTNKKRNYKYIPHPKTVTCSKTSNCCLVVSSAEELREIFKTKRVSVPFWERLRKKKMIVIASLTLKQLSTLIKCSSQNNKAHKMIVANHSVSPKLLTKVFVKANSRKQLQTKIKVIRPLKLKIISEIMEKLEKQKKSKKVKGKYLTKCSLLNTKRNLTRTQMKLKTHSHLSPLNSL